MFSKHIIIYNLISVPVVNKKYYTIDIVNKYLYYVKLRELNEASIRNVYFSVILINIAYYINKCNAQVFGSGKSGLIAISKCPQEILDRTSIIIDENKIEGRFYVGFPARGRSVLAKELEKILFNIIPNIVEKTLLYKNINSERLINRIELV